MFTLNDFNLLIGLSWCEDYNERIDLAFQEKADGTSEKVIVQCKGWSHVFTLKSPVKTSHLPEVMTFRSSELKILYTKLKAGYKNIDMVLPFAFDENGFEVTTGPGRGIKVNHLRR